MYFLFRVFLQNMETRAYTVHFVNLLLAVLCQTWSEIISFVSWYSLIKSTYILHCLGSLRFNKPCSEDALKRKRKQHRKTNCKSMLVFRGIWFLKDQWYFCNRWILLLVFHLHLYLQIIIHVYTNKTFHD